MRNKTVVKAGLTRVSTDEHGVV